METAFSIAMKDMGSLIIAANANMKYLPGPVYNVIGYGALGDGVADDTSAIQSAINDAYANGGGVVYFPPGTYLIKGTTGSNFLTLKSNVTLMGAGEGATTLKLGTVSSLSNAIIYCQTGATDIEISQLSIQGNGSSTMMQFAIYVVSNVRPKVRNVNISNMYAGLGNVYVVDSTYGDFNNIKIDSTSNLMHGICLMSTVASAGNYHKVTDCSVIDGAFAFRTLHSSVNTFSNCYAIGTTGQNTTSLEGFNVSGGTNNSFINCYAIKRGDGGYVENNLTETGFPAGVYPSRNRVIGLSSYSNFLCGLGISGKEGIYTDIISYNNAMWRVLDPGGSGTFTGQDDGIQIYTTASDNILDSITTFDSQGTHTQQYGIHILAGANKTHVTNHKHYGNVVSGLKDENTIQDNSVFGLSSNDIKFSVNKNGTTQSIPGTSAVTLLTWSAEKYDVGSSFSSDKFTPTRAGRYQLYAQVAFTPVASGNTVALSIYKNGTVIEQETRFVTSSTTFVSIQVSMVVEANGTTDYFDVRMFQNSGSAMNVDGSPWFTHFRGSYLG